jgi:hypothetical protein
MIPTSAPQPPLIPTKSGTQAACVRAGAQQILEDSAWVPAFAGMSGI